MLKQSVVLSLSAVLASQLMAAEDINEMFKEGKVGGYIRMHHIFPEASETIARDGSVIGGKLKYQTGALYGLRFGAALYTTHDTGLTDKKYRTHEGYSQQAQGLHGDDLGSYSTLGEAYANYHISNTDLTLGRQEFKTPMTEEAVTIIPNLFEGYVATIKEIPDFTISMAHITKMQYGTRAATDAGLIGDSAYAITAGTGYGFVAPTVNGTTGNVTTVGTGKESFLSMDTAIMGKNGTVNRMDTAGVTSIGIDYKKGDFKARVWDYYAHEMYNTIYADAEYKLNAGPAKVTLGAQFLKQDDIADFATSAGGTALKTVTTVRGVKSNPLYYTKLSDGGEIDAVLFGAQAKADIGDFSFSAGYNQNDKGHIINAWGGDPAYTSMIFSRNEYRADTKAYKLGAEYDLKSFIPGLKLIYNHAEYNTDVDTYNSTGTTFQGVKNEQTQVDDYILHYAVPSVKGLWFRLFHVQRDNDTRQYEQEHTRLIANLSF